MSSSNPVLRSDFLREEESVANVDATNNDAAGTKTNPFFNVKSVLREILTRKTFRKEKETRVRVEF